MASPTLDPKDNHEDILVVKGSEVSRRPTEVTGLGEWTTSRRELWCFYLYYVGNNGLSPFNLGPSQFQNLLYLAGYDPTHPPFAAPCSSGTDCVLPYLGRVRNINSIILLTNGISFAFQTVLLLVIGAWADYGTWRPNITIVFTLLGVGVSFAWLGVEDPSQWRAGACSLAFWGAAFPGLARNLPEVQASADEVKKGLKSLNGHAELESMQRNRISNISLVVSSAGEVVILLIMVGILKALKSDANVENNTRAFSVLIAFSGGMWLLCAIPWFIFENRRPGLTLPPGTSLATVGFKQTSVAFRECLRLKQTFLYLVFFFIMGDVSNTAIVVSYSTLQLTFQTMVCIATQGLGTFLFWSVQRKFNISTKKMLLFNVFWILVLTVWGLAGVHTNKIGFKHIWEIWLYQGFFGLMICPWWAYGQTMISEVAPLSQMSVGKASALTGPIVSEAIISASGNNNMPFAFLFGFGTFGTIFLFMVDVKKSRVECDEFVAAEAACNAFGTGSA
ncbi:MFS general substrate transporter [Lactifluus subvellereus]|nr:MFS general substrate transporter [Lactifluus subvellereus]